RLLERGRSVIGLDNLDPYYDVRLKQARLKQLAGFSAFGFERLDIADRAGMAAFFSARRFPMVVHLAAQAGVRHSLVDSHVYVDANVAGFLNVLEGRPVQLFNHGRMRRDFTYIDDAAEAVLRILDRAPQGDPRWSGEHPDPAGSRASWRLYNIGNGRPVEVDEVLRLIEEAAGRT